jgi:RND family efflux transporter MFP subunit
MRLLAPLVLLASALSTALAADAPKPLELRAARPTRGDVVRYVAAPGTIKPAQQATLYAKVPGYLKSLAVDRGDTVTAGQPLAVIEVPELTADLAKQKAEADVAATIHRRLTDAQKKSPDLVTPVALDEAAGRLAIARAALERTETLLSFAKITAPFAGVVTARHVDVGAFIPAATSGSAANTAALVTIMDLATVRVTASVPELDAALVAVGQPVKFSFEALPGKTFEARVSRFGYALDPATKTMVVEADAPNPGLALRPGLYITARIGVEKHTGVITLPVDALVMEKAASFVFKALDGKAKKTAIKLGFNDGTRFEIAEGLAETDLVLLPGKTALTDGQPVTAIEQK